MKKLLLFVFLLSAYCTKAQNYQCLQSGVKHYFINSDNYLRGIRIDSVVAIGDTQVYYPYKTIRSYPSYDTAGSWLGQKVLGLPNGDFVFDNIAGDTIVIKTQASIGDTWLFYSDTTSETYKATLTSVDTMTILGTLDSIKTITINAYHSGILDAASQVNNFQLILSKNSGFVKVFDLYTFPYPYTSFGYYLDDYLNYISAYSSSSDPFLDKQTFIITPYHDPTMLEMYNLNVGDMFAGNYNTNSTCSYAMNITNYIHYDSVIYKSVIDSFHVIYAIHHVVKGTYENDYPGGSTVSPFLNDYIDTLKADTSLIFLRQMPEEYTVGPYVYYFNPTDTSFCYQSPFYRSFVIGSYDECLMKAEFKLDFLTVWDTTGCSTDPACAMGAAMGYTRTVNDTMFYSLKGGVSCNGIILPSLDVKNIDQNNTINIFPNPARNEININTLSDQIEQVDIFNLLGQTVFYSQYNARNVAINIAQFSPGIYFMKVNGVEVRKFVKE